MPSRDDAHEDLQWLLRTIEAEGGEATRAEARIARGGQLLDISMTVSAANGGP